MKSIRMAFYLWVLLMFAIRFMECKHPEPAFQDVSTEVFSGSGDPVRTQNPSFASPLSARESIKSDHSVDGPETRVLPGSQVVLAALVKSECSTCHTQSLPTAKAGALAFFDLEETPWYQRLKEEDLHGLEKRILGNDKFHAEAQEALVQFVSCFMGENCPDN